MGACLSGRRTDGCEHPASPTEGGEKPGTGAPSGPIISLGSEAPRCAIHHCLAPVLPFMRFFNS